MDPVFCTVLSKLRVYQALALIYSLDQVLPSYILYVLCVDAQTKALFSKTNLKHVRLLGMEDLNERTLTRLKKSRRLNEYCWTLKPVLIETLFYKRPLIPRVTYLDADLFFYSSPMVIFEQNGEASILLSRGEMAQPQLSAQAVKRLQSLMGQYNSGFISFKRDQSALACLKWWKTRCLESCLTHPEAGRFGDQRYLDEMPYLFRNVRQIETPGVNIGHWNSSQYSFSVHDGHLYINRFRLICYHFSGYRIIHRDRITQIYEANRPSRPFFYRDYTKILQSMMDRVQKLDASFNGCSTEEDLNLTL